MSLLLMLCVCIIPLSVNATGISSCVRGLWHFDEGIGTAVYDSSGNNNHGTLYGGALWADGKDGMAIDFDGVDDYIEVPDANSLDITAEITLEAWIYPHTMTHLQGIVAKYNHSAPYNGAYYVGLGGYGYMNKILFGLSYDGLHFYYMLSNTNITANTWTHVAATSNSTHMTLYINRIKDKVRAYAPGVIYASAAPLRIGCYLPELGFPRFFDGIIDEVKVSATTIWTVDDDRVQCPTADFTSIQATINAAGLGDTILVYDGTYNEALFIDKSLTIKAASSPVIKGSQLFATDYGNREAVIFVKDASDVVLEDLDIEGEDLGPGPTKSYGVLYQNSSGTIRNCTVSPNTLGDMYSVGIAAISASNLLIESCTVENFGRIGIYATNVDMIAIYYNEIIGQIYAGAGEVNYGIEIEDYDGPSTAEIVGNEIYNSDNTNPSPSWSSAAIIVDIWRMYYDLAPSNVSIEYNEIHDNYLAIEVVSNPSLYAHYNTIYNNGYGVFVDPDSYNNNETFDARFNWWGDASGPYHNNTNLLGLGNEVGDYVLYSPWFGFVTGTSPMTYHVNPTGKIQDAIDDASSDDTVKVHEGTYTEQLIINKTLTLQGDPGPKIVAPDTRNTYTIAESSATWDPIIFAYGGTESSGAVSGSGTISVTIDGFEIDGGNKAAAAPTRFVGILYRNVNPGVVSNDNIHDLYDAEGEGDGPQTFGIMAYGDSDVTIESNEVRDFSRGGIGVSGDAGALPDPTATVKLNTVLGNGLETGSGWWAENGIQIAWGAGGSIIENNVSGCQVNSPSWVATGIMVYDAVDGANISDNSVADCDTGIAVISPSYDLIDGNVVTGCAWDAIRLGWPVNNCTVSNNILSDNWAGIGIWDASDNTIENNIIENNEYGIYMDGDSHDNAILGNEILDNVIDGIHIEPYGGFDPSGTEIHCNKILGNGICGVNKTGTEIADATWNWWGDNTGPYHPTTNPSGTGDRVSDNVDYDPWKMRPTLKVDPSSTTIGLINKTFTINITINDLQAGWKGVGFEFRLTYNSTLLKVLNVAEGPFLVGFPQSTTPPYTLFIYYIDEKPYTSTIVGALLLPNSTGDFPGPFPSGNGILATITFQAIYQEKGYSKVLGYLKPPLTCNLTLMDTLIVDLGLTRIGHYTEDGSYTIEPNNYADINWDGKVRVDDVLEAAGAFGTQVDHPRWNPAADLNSDGKIRVDDILAIAHEFGWTHIDC